LDVPASIVDACGHVTMTVVWSIAGSSAQWTYKLAS